MSPSSRPARERLLASLLVTVAVAGCGEDRHTARLGYSPGGAVPGGSVPATIPDGPCLSAADPAVVGYLVTSCKTSVRVESGPVETTDAAGKRTCTYDVSYKDQDPCAAVGRPLAAGERVVVATLRGREDWAG